MAASYGAGGQSPPVIGRPVDRVFEDAQFTGEVNLSGRKLRDYPKICTKYDLSDTIHTDLSKNRFSEVPAEVCDYCNMERLNCYHNIIKSIPEAIVQLQSLTHLNLSRNQLTVLPVSLCTLSSLEVLLASNNKLVSLPEEIGKLERLMDLDVSCNEISHLPPQIGDLRSLRSLNLRRNLLVELPLDICKLNLRRLDIASNRVQKIPTVFRKLEVLEEIILEHNPLESPPAHVCTRGRQHIMKYLHTEAVKEDRKRGILSDADMKRLIRKSLPPQHPYSGKLRRTSDEFRQMLEAPEAKWKRHTVLSSDSGYSTADSLDKCGWNHAETAQQQGVAMMMGGGEVLDENSMLAFKAAEAVREQRQSHNYHQQQHNNNSNLNNAHIPSDLARIRLHPTPASPTLSTARSTSPNPVSLAQQPSAVLSMPSLSSSRDFSQVAVSSQAQPPLSPLVQQCYTTPPSPLLQQRYVTPPSPLPQQRYVMPPSPLAQHSMVMPPSPLVQRHSNHHQHHMNHQPFHQRQSNAYAPPPSQSHYQNHAPPPLSNLQHHSGVESRSFHNPHHTAPNQSYGGGGEEFPPPPAPLAFAEEEELTPPVTPPTPLAQQVMSVPSGSSLEDEFSRIFMELLRQKQEYEQRKKQAEQIRLAQEEKERDERRRTAQKLQEEQRAVLERQREEQQRAAHQEQQRLMEEQARQEEEARLREEARRQEEERARARQLEEEQHRNKALNKNALSSQSVKDQRRLGSNTQYRRTSSDTVTSKRSIPTAVSNSHGEGLNNHLNKNGLADEDDSISPSSSHSSKQATTPTNPSVWRLGGGGGERASSPVPSPGSRRSKPPERSSVPTPTSARSVSRTSSTSSVNSVQSQSSITGKAGSSTITTTTTTTASTATQGGSRTPKNHQTPEEEFKAKHQQVKSQTQLEAQRIKSRLEDPRSKGTTTPTMGAKRPGVPDTDNKRHSGGGRPAATTAGKNSRPVLSAGAMKMLEEYKDVNPNFTIRRREEQQREENQQLEMLRQTIESRLKVTLPDNLPEALRDGVVLCHLANQIRPRSVASIHVPSPAVPKLTSAKCRRNVENFLDACRKIGVDQDQLCMATDIMEERGALRVAMTVAALVTAGSHPRQSAV